MVENNRCCAPNGNRAIGIGEYQVFFCELVIPDEKNFANVERTERNGKSRQGFWHLVGFIFFGKPTFRHYIYIDLSQCIMRQGLLNVASFFILSLYS